MDIIYIIWYFECIINVGNIELINAGNCVTIALINLTIPLTICGAIAIILLINTFSILTYFENL